MPLDRDLHGPVTKRIFAGPVGTSMTYFPALPFLAYLKASINYSFVCTLLLFIPGLAVS